MKKMKNNNEIEIESAEPLSPHNEALYETGKEMLKSSITTGTDFCRFMITFSFGAIPTYLALLKFVLPEKVVLSIVGLILSLIPPFIFLVSAIIFVFGYLPTTSRFSLDIIEEIKGVYEETIMRRKRIIKIGLIVFLIGSTFAILSIVACALGLSI
jgi:hypothetical protein